MRALVGSSKSLVSISCSESKRESGGVKELGGSIKMFGKKEN